MTNAAIRYNLTDIQHRLPYGRARQLIQEFMESTYKSKEMDMEALGVANPLSLYNSCFQTARRHFVGCRVSRQNKKYLIFEKI